MATVPDTNGKPLAGDKAVEKARDLLTGFRSAMLITRALEDSEICVRPMGMVGDPKTFGGRLWFFADDRSRKVAEIASDRHASVVFQNDDQSRYLHLTGTASVVNDKTTMRELYTTLIKVWFPDGLEDPHLTLIRFDAEAGHFWDSPGGVLQVLAAFTKSTLTGIPGKGGQTGTLQL
jgi:general stress protein 26